MKPNIIYAHLSSMWEFKRETTQLVYNATVTLTHCGHWAMLSEHTVYLNKFSLRIYVPNKNPNVVGSTLNLVLPVKNSRKIRCDFTCVEQTIYIRLLLTTTLIATNQLPNSHFRIFVETVLFHNLNNWLSLERNHCLLFSLIISNVPTLV